MGYMTSDFLVIKQKFDKLIDLNISSRITQEIKIKNRVDSLITDCKIGNLSKNEALNVLNKFNYEELSKDQNDLLKKSEIMFNEIEYLEKKLNYKENKKIQKYKKTVTKILLSLQGKNEDIDRLKKYLTS